MDALVPAFVAALLAGIADRPARLAAELAARSGVAGVIAGLILGHTCAIAISIVGALWIAPTLAPNARSLLVAVALILAAIGALWQRRATPASANVFVAAAAGGFLAGDGTAFLAFAFAVRGSAPILAGVGALAGASVLAVAAAMAGRDWQRVPLVWLGRAAGMVLLITGLIVASGALRLI